jgi:type I restriction enzyme S subunit
MRPEFDRLTMGSTHKTIYQGDAAGLHICVPSLPEQAGIATFLDRETAKIDALVADYRTLIELLQEKRQAVISHAVTKGLDPTVPMKDSGVEWLGEVPEHWKVLPLKRIVSTPITDGPHETPEFLDSGVPFVSAEAVASGSIDFEKIRGFISPADNAKYSQKYAPRVGDIYMVKSGATTGVAVIVETDLEFNIWSPLAAIRCGAVAHPYFVLNAMRSRNFQESVILNWSYGTQQNIGMGVIENLAVPIPSITEQKDIAGFLDNVIANIDALITDAQEAITLLQERRTALISAAVTGKIDVRGLVAIPENELVRSCG